MNLSKLQREEAKISAWENLQKAKAEAPIRKLGVKLEKKKSASVDKILNKLQTAKIKAQEMRRSSVSTEPEQQQQQQQMLRKSEKIGIAKTGSDSLADDWTHEEELPNWYGRHIRDSDAIKDDKAK